MEIINLISKYLWSIVLPIALVGTGIYMTVLLKFPQFTRVLPAFGRLIHDIKTGKQVPEGRMTPFQSLATAVAAQVGTGNIVGVATAMAAGGPGAAFWMILVAFFGMSTIFSEAVLAQMYRREGASGQLAGGPAYYISEGLNNKVLATIFAIFCVIALGIVGIMVQSNAIVISLNSSFNIPILWGAIGLLVLVGAILQGGMDRIAAFSEKVVPIMAGGYVLGSLIVVIMNIGNLLPALQMIMVGAFTPQAIGGGVLGITIQEAIRYGLARGLFSNEAGLGSTPHSHAVASTDHPAEQGFIAMIGVFICTFMVCMATVAINLTSGAYNPNIPAVESTKTATLMTQNAFTLGFGGFGGAFLAISLSSFALTTVVGWYFFAESNVKYLTNDNKFFVLALKVVSLSALTIGGFVDPTMLWQLVDLFTGSMALPNIIALVFLSKQVKYVLADYDKKIKAGNLVWPTKEELPGYKKKA